MHDCRTAYLHFLKGKGLEIGALLNPLPLPPGAEALFADCLTPAQLDEQYPGARHPDIVSDGESFAGVDHNTFDFIVANHVLEHVTDPIAALTEWHRILRPNGVLFMALPDKRFTFDAARKRTTLAHLIEDHASTLPAKDRNFSHLKEWATCVEGFAEGSPEWQNWIDDQYRRGYSVHNHVWILDDILTLLRHLRFSENIRYDLAAYSNTPVGDIEFVVILRANKSASSLRERFFSDAAFLFSVAAAQAKCLCRRVPLLSKLVRIRRQFLNSISRSTRTLKRLRRGIRTRERESDSGELGIALSFVDGAEDPGRYVPFFAASDEALAEARHAMFNPELSFAQRMLPTSWRESLGLFSCSLTPIREIEPSLSGTYVASGSDPQFSLGTEHGLFPSGLSVVTFRWQSNRPCDPQLYFYVRGELGESLGAHLTAVREGISQTLVLFPDDIQGIRFDPCQTKGEFSITEFSIREFRSLSVGEREEVIRLFVSVGVEYNQNLLTFFEREQKQRVYQDWISKHERLRVDEEEEIQAAIQSLPKKPLFSILMPTYNPPIRWLELAIESLQAQAYPHWELCIADDASTSAGVRERLTAFSAADDRIKIHLRSENGNISAATNSALELATGEYVTFVDQDDMLHPLALYFFALELNRFPAAALLYSDEDKVTPEVCCHGSGELPRKIPGMRYDPCFKPNWNPLLLLTQNYVCHLCVCRRDLLQELGELRLGYEGVQDWDLVLRLSERIDLERIRHVPRVLYHWRSIAGSTANRMDAKPEITERSLSLIQDTLQRRNIAGVPLHDRSSGRIRVRYEVRENPEVALLIPTRDRIDLLSRCVESALALTAYQNFRVVILDNDSTAEESARYFSAISEHDRVEVFSVPGRFNFSRINNRGAEHAQSEFFCFLNNDTEVVEPDWLREMVSLAQLPRTGAVGAKLLYSDGRIQHAGVILGVGGVANHAFYQEREGEIGQSRIQSVQYYSAVTGACMLVRRSIFEELGGFDEANVPVAFSDTDFCLRALDAGYRNVWTPHAVLYHHESSSRGPEHRTMLEEQSEFHEHEKYMHARWGHMLHCDPYYNQNASLTRADFSPAFPPRLSRY